MRDLPRSEEQLRKTLHFEFQNWAVNALGGIPDKTKTGDKGIDGKIYSVSATPEEKAKAGQGEFDSMDVWRPV